MNGNGDRQRPCNIDNEEWDNRWEKAFSSKKECNDGCQCDVQSSDMPSVSNLELDAMIVLMEESDLSLEKIFLTKDLARSLLLELRYFRHRDSNVGGSHV